VYCKLVYMNEPPAKDGNLEHPGPAAGVPRWVKVSGVIAVLLVLVVVVLLLAGHDPGRHVSGLG
jgi:hypothetical protein